MEQRFGREFPRPQSTEMKLAIPIKCRGREERETQTLHQKQHFLPYKSASVPIPGHWQRKQGLGLDESLFDQVCHYLSRILFRRMCHSVESNLSL